MRSERFLTAAVAVQPLWARSCCHLMGLAESQAENLPVGNAPWSLAGLLSQGQIAAGPAQKLALLPVDLIRGGHFHRAGSLPGRSFVGELERGQPAGPRIVPLDDGRLGGIQTSSSVTSRPTFRNFDFGATGTPTSLPTARWRSTIQRSVSCARSPTTRSAASPRRTFTT